MVLLPWNVGLKTIIKYIQNTIDYFFLKWLGCWWIDKVQFYILLILLIENLLCVL